MAVRYTIRDTFAQLFAPVLLTQALADARVVGRITVDEDAIAEDAYRLAEAMMRERQKTVVVIAPTGEAVATAPPGTRHPPAGPCTNGYRRHLWIEGRCTRCQKPDARSRRERRPGPQLVKGVA